MLVCAARRLAVIPRTVTTTAVIERAPEVSQKLVVRIECRRQTMQRQRCTFRGVNAA